MRWLETFSLLVLVVTFANCSKPQQGKFTFTIKNTGELSNVFRSGLYLNSSIYMTLRPRAGSCPPADKASVCWTVRGIDCMTVFSSNNNPLFKQPWDNLGMNQTGMYASNCATKDGNNDPIEVSCTQKVSHVKKYDRSRWYPTDAYTEPDSSRRRRAVDQPALTDTKMNDAKSPTDDSKNKPVESRVDKSIPVDQPALTDTAKSPKDDSKNKPVESRVDKSIPVDQPALSDTAKSPVDAVSSNLPSAPVVEKKTSTEPKKQQPPANEKGLVTKVPMEGFYHVAVWIDQQQDATNDIEIDVTLELKNPFQGYLSAFDYPLLTFYMIMCILYAFYAAAWLLMSACHYRDLLRVQFWIGGVILLGMIEKAVFYAEYKNVDDTGISMVGAAKFAELVSSLKRALARMLVIIVSLGFGIVKPRLGPMLHRVIAAGVLYFTLAVVDAFVRHDIDEGSSEKKLQFYTFIPLAIVDSIICWWVFISLLQTMKTLRLRRNVVKLALYRHFFNTIILCVIMSVVLVFWTYRSKNVICVENWQELWLEPALWHVLFSVILLVIMVLWRPNANNQIYAYSPMIDGNDSDASDEGEPMLGGGATESMKLRAVNRDGSGKEGGADQTEADLKWIDENIPQTMADTALPILLDSDDDVRDTKLEMSKIE